MSDHQHYTGCHLHHFPCALARIRELEREVVALSGFRRDRLVLDAPEPETVLTVSHDLSGMQYLEVPQTPPFPIPCHDRLPGATWTHPIADEPPVSVRGTV